MQRFGPDFVTEKAPVSKSSAFHKHRQDAYDFFLFCFLVGAISRKNESPGYLATLNAKKRAEGRREKRKKSFEVKGGAVQAAMQTFELQQHTQSSRLAVSLLPHL